MEWIIKNIPFFSFFFFFFDTLLRIFCFRCNLLQENRDLIFLSLALSLLLLKLGVGKISKSIVSVGKTIWLWKKEERVVKKRWMTDRLTGSLNDRQPFLVSTSSAITTLLSSSKSTANLIIEFMVEQGAYAVYSQSSSFKCYLSHIYSLSWLLLSSSSTRYCRTKTKAEI